MMNFTRRVNFGFGAAIVALSAITLGYVFLALSVTSNVLLALIFLNAVTIGLIASGLFWFGRQLTFAYAEKESALNARNELTAIVSHELKNPLSAILMNVELVRRSSVHGGDTEFLLRAMDRVEASAERMNRLISDLMDISRIQLERLRVIREPVDVAEIVKEAIEASSDQFQKKSIRVAWEIQPTCSRVVCDKGRTIQVLNNLLDNAIKFTEAGGMVTIRVVETDDSVCFTVSDTGSGIKVDEMPHIFDKFWQAKRSAYSGVGLGLPIAKGIVEAQGGKIWAKSEEGKGAAFSFNIPCVREELHPRSPR